MSNPKKTWAEYCRERIGWYTCGREWHGPYETNHGGYVAGECGYCGQFVCGFPLFRIDETYIESLEKKKNLDNK